VRSANCAIALEGAPCSHQQRTHAELKNEAASPTRRNVMNWNVMLEVVMSAIFFAPLLIIFGAMLFVGALAAFEGVVALARNVALPAGAASPVIENEAGPVVAGFKAAIEEEAEAARENGEAREAGNAKHG
jgi:hypothetical protein